jgi:opacity protein-like surface antigen
MPRIVSVVCLCVVLGSAAGAAAQTVGVGPRLSFVRSDVHADHSTRVTGGVLRLRPSNRAAFELALDYRSSVGENLAERIKDYPIQASMLLYGGRSALAPYLLGGVGWYGQSIEVQNEAGTVSTSSRKRGYHAGLGADLSFGRHVKIHGDYRYTFIGTGDDADTAPAAVPIPGLRALQDKLGLSHKGSMWTTGLMLYF